MNKPQSTGKVIVIVAPSGAGKTTIANRLLEEFDCIKLSVSATTRPPRPGETHGKDYFFLNTEQFNELIQKDGFLEWEEFYGGTRYGTLRSEVDKLAKSGYFPLLDIEVKGAKNVKQNYGSNCISIFIQPPSLEALEQRLLKRGTETEQSLQMRLDRAEKEMMYAKEFDYTVINDDLDGAYEQVKAILYPFVNQ